FRRVVRSRREELIDRDARRPFLAPIGLEVLDLVRRTFLVDDAQVDIEAGPQLVAQAQAALDIALNLFQLRAADLLVGRLGLRIDAELDALYPRFDYGAGQIPAHQVTVRGDMHRRVGNRREDADDLRDVRMEERLVEL